MNNLRSWAGSALFVLLFGGQMAQADSREGVPIKGSFQGTVQVTPIPQAEMSFQVVYSATGTVSHLGQVQATLVTPQVKVGAMQLTLLTPKWKGTITAANGDQLFGTYVLPGTINLTATGTFSFNADLVVQGGTGRFANAQGQAQASGTANIFTRTFNVEIAGWISKVGP
jgi:hypothetical protein